jgi:multidrug resistance efflux pump
MADSIWRCRDLLSDGLDPLAQAPVMWRPTRTCAFSCNGCTDTSPGRRRAPARRGRTTARDMNESDSPASALPETPDGGFVDPNRWAAFNAAAQRSPLAPGAMERFCSAWLELLCSSVENVVGAQALLLDAVGARERVAQWPADDSSDADALSRDIDAVCDAAADAKRGVVLAARSGRTAPGRKLLAFPVMGAERPVALAALIVEPVDDAALQLAMRRLQWALGWFEGFLSRRETATAGGRPLVMDLVALALEGDSAYAALLGLSAEMASRLACERVAFGFRRGPHNRLEVLSHSADFGARSNLARGFEGLMDEATDQRERVIWPRPEGVVQIDREHERFSREQGSAGLVTLPLVVAGEVIGAMTLERAEQPFDPQTLETARQAALFLAPALQRQRLADRGAHRVLWDTGTAGLQRLLGPGAYGMKLTALLAGALILFFAFATGVWRVTADAVLEGTIRQVVTAPIDGYVLESRSRPGDLVEAGEALALLDDRELQLERARWYSQRTQRAREYDEALAEHEWARVRILGAQMDQADAQLELIDAQLARTRLAAPFAGVVVSGDLSQNLGAPVNRGDVLFEVAPLDDYRIILKVDERDIGALEASQRGRLVLAGMPDVALPFVLDKVTPVSRTEEGRNYFRVEASLDDATGQAALRPGMEGVAKIDVERRRLLWIWTHRAWMWLRLTLWTWVA